MHTIPLLSSFVLALLTGPVMTPPSPSSSASPGPLHEIARTRTSAFCTALRENIGPALFGLIVNDRIVEHSKRVFAKMSVDAKIGGDMNLDEMHMGTLVGAMVHNLGGIDHLISDPGRFPSTPQSDRERELLQMQSEVRDVAGAQQSTLNVIDGVIETQALGSLQHSGASLGGGAASPAPASPSPASTAAADLFDAGLGTNPGDPVRPQASADPDLLLYGGLYGPFVRALAVDQTHLQVLEQTLSRSVTTAAASCNSPAPTP